MRSRKQKRAIHAKKRRRRNGNRESQAYTSPKEKEKIGSGYFSKKPII